METSNRFNALFKGMRFFSLNRPKQPLEIKHIVILGDSVAYGYGTRGGIAKYLKETFPGSKVTNLGINGLTSNGLVERLYSDHWQQPLKTADLVLLNIGGNDLLRGFRSNGAKGLLKQFSSLKRIYRKNLLKTYEYIRKQNGQALIVQNNLYNSVKKDLQFFGFTALLFRLWNNAIGEKGVVVSRTDAMGKNPSIWLDDIHPNDEGYKLMHELLLKTLVTTGFYIQTKEILHDNQSV